MKRWLNGYDLIASSCAVSAPQSGTPTEPAARRSQHQRSRDQGHRPPWRWLMRLSSSPSGASALSDALSEPNAAKCRQGYAPRTYMGTIQIWKGQIGVAELQTNRACRPTRSTNGSPRARTRPGTCADGEYVQRRKPDENAPAAPRSRCKLPTVAFGVSNRWWWIRP